MKSRLGHKISYLAIAVALTMILPAAWGKGLDDFKLVKAIPADAFLAVHGRDHDGKEFLNKQFARVWEAVEAAHFDRDIKKMLKTLQSQGLEPGTEPEGFEEWWQQMKDLATAVDWASLSKREFAMGMKQGFPTVEIVMLMMPPEDQIKDSFDGLGGVLKTLVGMNPAAFTLTTEEDGNTVIHKVGVAAPFPLGLTLARHKDVILIGFGPAMPEQTLALLRGEGGEPLSASDRFQSAFKKLPAPTDEAVFFDIAKFMKQLRDTVNGALAMAAPAAPAEGEEGYDEFVKVKALPDKIIHAIDMFEYQAEVKTTDGMLSTTDSVTVLRDDAKQHALYPVFFGNQPIKDPLKYVPENAAEFWVTSGVDLGALYQAVVKILREDVPDGEQIVAQIEALKDAETNIGLDIEKDIFGWFGGSLTMFSVPGATPYANSEFLFMLGVSDEAKAQEMIGRLFAMIEPMLVQNNGAIVDAEIEGAEGFKSVMHPMLAMVRLTKPTLGVKDGWLFFGSSPDMILTSTKVASGQVANFSKNERFLKEGIQPTGSVTSLSFTDKTKFGEELGQALSMVPAIPLAVPDLAKNPMAQSALNMVGKLGRVVRKLDFFQSSASRSTFDGKVVMTRSVNTYREPPVITKPKPPTTETEGQP